MNKICDECETVAHCTKHGCIPKQQALNKMAENARELGLDYEPVCNKDPKGCWNVRCQIKKKCKNTPAQRKPLTDAQILQTLRPNVWAHVEGGSREFMLADARAIKAAHNIKENT